MSILNIFKKKKQEQVPKLLAETNNKLNNKKSFFSNYDKYSNEPEFIKEFVKIITDKEEYEVDENSEFEDAIKYLIENNYLASYNINDNLVKTLNNKFKENINEEQITKKVEEYKINSEYKDVIKLNITELEICNQLEPKGKGLIYIYSAGDYYCYGIETQEKIDRIRYLFK